MPDLTEASIEVPVAPDAVLGVLADLPAYPHWASGLTRAEVLDTDAAGRPSRARLTVTGGPVRDTYVLDYAWSATGVRWSLVSSEVLRRLDGQYVLEPLTGGATRVRYRLALQARLPVLAVLRRRAERFIADRALADLRARLAGPGGTGGTGGAPAPDDDGR